MWRHRLALAAVFAASLAACGGGASAPRLPFTYGPTPSVSALQICHEAVGDIAPVLGVATTTHPVATWVDHQYTCPYRYATGTMTLWVKELPTLAATEGYMAMLRRELGVTGGISNVGSGGFTTRDGSTVTRKDNKVLVVDIAGLPAMFGHPATTRAEVALTVTDIVFACWRGD